MDGAATRAPVDEVVGVFVVVDPEVSDVGVSAGLDPVAALFALNPRTVVGLDLALCLYLSWSLLDLGRRNGWQRRVIVH